MPETAELEPEAAALSYLRGADVPFLNLTLCEALAETAGRFPDREALVVCHEGVRLTWSELDREVTRAARGLAGLGLAPGDRAGIWASNCLEWVLLQYAAPRAGVVLVNVNPAYRSHELRYVLAKSHIRALFLHEKDFRANYRQILADSRNGDRLPLEHIVWLGGASWDAMLAGGTDFPPDAAAPDDVVNIQYTSGTTGAPKGAMLSHRNLLNNGMAMATGLKATEHDRICAPVPLYHCFGSVIGSMVSVVSGATLILPSAQFDALATLERRSPRAGHRALRRPHHVYRGDGASRICALRPDFAAHRRDGGLALPHRGDASRGGAHALSRDYHCVRTDRVFARASLCRGRTIRWSCA